MINGGEWVCIYLHLYIVELSGKGWSMSQVVGQLFHLDSAFMRTEARGVEQVGMTRDASVNLQIDKFLFNYSPDSVVLI